VEHHDRWTFHRSVFEAVHKGAIYVLIAESVSAYQDCVCLVGMADQRRVQWVERLDQQLVKLETSSY